MSSGKSAKNSGKGKKKGNSKRPASSPLNEDGRVNKTGSVRADGQCRVNNGDVHGDSVDYVSTQYTTLYTPYLLSDISGHDPSMAFSQQYNVFAVNSQGMPIQSPGCFPNQAHVPRSPTMISAQPPDWAASLINDVQTIKSQVAKIDSVEKTVQSINDKIKTLETKVGSMNDRLTTVENSCSFISGQFDTQSTELKQTKDELKKLKSSVSALEKDAESLGNQKSELESKMNDLEYRSMRDNLLFYGLPEAENENCETLIKSLIADKLQYPDAEKILFDRAHRLGKRSSARPRPIVAKFHYYKERELVRTKSFEYAESLKSANMGVGVQMPKSMRETRKSLQPVMRREKEKGNAVKFVKDKLFINGVMYKGPEAGTSSMP